MKSLSELFESLDPEKFSAKIQKLSQIFKAIFAISGAVSMKAIARVSDIPERSLERYYDYQWQFEDIRVEWFRTEALKDKNIKQDFIAAFDDTTQPKAGKKTNGLGNFYCTKQKRGVNAISVFSVSLIEVETKNCYPLFNRQVIQTEADKARIETDKQRRKQNKGKPKGRKKGVKNKTEEEAKEIQHTAQYRCLDGILSDIPQAIKPDYWVGDGAFGNVHYIDLLKKHDVFLVSKLRYDANLYLPFSGTPKDRGRKPVLGDKVDWDDVSNVEKGIGDFAGVRSFIAYFGQGKSRRKVRIVACYADLSKPSKRVVLFSTDLDLSTERVIEIYQVRFQIEFVFREAKQYFGLSTFKNTKASRVTTAIELAFTSVFISKLLQAYYAQELDIKKVSTLDVRVMERLLFQVEQILILNDIPPEPYLNTANIHKLATMEAINL